MRTTRTSPGEFRPDHDQGQARLRFVPYGAGLKDVIIPGLTAGDLRAIADAADAEADDMDPAGLDGVEAVQVRLTGTPQAVARMTTLLGSARGMRVSTAIVKNRTPDVSQGYLTMIIPKGHDQ